MMCSDNKEAFYKKANVSSSIAERRLNVYDRFQDYVPSSLVIPPHRLECLLQQALQLQKSNCVYHTTVDSDISLYQDHICAKSNFPRVTTHVLDEHKDEVWFVCFSHDGKYLASASKDSNIIIWDTALWTPVFVLTGHDESVSFLAWSKNDTMLVSCSNDKKAKLWDVKVFSCFTLFLVDWELAEDFD
jgi:WD repeat-containing protein 26